MTFLWYVTVQQGNDTHTWTVKATQPHTALMRAIRGERFNQARIFIEKGRQVYKKTCECGYQYDDNLENCPYYRHKEIMKSKIGA